MTQKRKKILVVDDEPHIVNLIKLSLQDSFIIKEAFSGSEAIMLAKKEKPDLVVLDLMMPNMNGFEVCSKLRTMAETKDIPVLILSAKSQIVDKFKSINAGADDYMVKPFDPAELVKRIEMNLGRA